MQLFYTMRNFTLLEGSGVQRHTLWMKYVILTSRLGLGPDRGALSEGLITQLGFGEVVSGYLVAWGLIWTEPGSCGGSI